MKRNNWKKYIGLFATSLVLVACGSEDTDSSEPQSKPADAPDTWIADRTITGLIFQSAGDVGADSMSPEIQEYIKERTGITLELQGITSEDSTQALAAGLAAGDLPDFIGFYLNNSGRPEFPMLLQAANEGMFHDIAPYLKEGEAYGRYYEEGYLPRDTAQNIMMREEHDGATYLVHMAIDEEPADPGQKTIGGMWIRKDIAEELDIEYGEVTTSEEFSEVLKEIQSKNFTDNNGNPVTPLGPSSWGGSDRIWPYQDLVWTGATNEKFFKNDNGEILHESQTDYAMRRVEYIHDLMNEGLMHPEYYTMEETRAQEGIANGSFAIISDTHQYRPEIQDGSYVPFGDLNRASGNNHMIMPYKSGYAGWAVPSTTDRPEEVVAFADWLASEEGKLLYFYGLEGVHYEMGDDGKPIPDSELVELLDSNPDQGKEEGFRGVRAYWGEHLGYTNMNNLEQFGEQNWGDKVRENSSNTSNFAQEIIEYTNYDERYENKEVIDGLTPRSYIYQWTVDRGIDDDLSAALDAWDEELLKAYYANTSEDAQKILDAAAQKIKDAGVEDFIQFLEEKEEEGEILYF